MKKLHKALKKPMIILKVLHYVSRTEKPSYLDVFKILKSFGYEDGTCLEYRNSLFKGQALLKKAGEWYEVEWIEVTEFGTQILRAARKGAGKYSLDQFIQVNLNLVKELERHF